jgi:hypothetical protein
MVIMAYPNNTLIQVTDQLSSHNINAIVGNDVLWRKFWVQQTLEQRRLTTEFPSSFNTMPLPALASKR